MTGALRLRRQRRFITALIGCLSVLVLAACSSDTAAAPTADLETSTPFPATPSLLSPNASATPTPSPSPSPTSTIDPTPAVVGPNFTQGFNPLTGLPMNDNRSLFRVPLLVSISEFPPSARPQAGLSFADQVWETSIAQGMTRFLAVFYGDYMDRFNRVLSDNPKLDRDSTIIGPVRSGRVGYEQIKDFFPGGLLFIRSASPQVAEQLTDIIVVYASDVQDVNSATLSMADLEALDVPSAGPADYTSLVFEDRPPAGGAPAPSLSIIYNLYDQIEWTYDPTTRKYLRSQDTADGTGKLVPSVDRLTGARLSADNVVVMFAQHTFENRGATIVGIELAYVPKRHGILFRDGRMYDVTWSSPKSKLTFTDESLRLIAFNPGNTYFEVVSFESTWDSQERVVRWHNPPLPTEPPPPILPPKPTKSPTPGEPAPGPEPGPA
jgi:Protein of unknown function (DUF3048) C-terminal domain/Protein of unknown function (DUF3048) N-terminal domain